MGKKRKEKRMKKSVILSMLAIVIINSGCASLVTGTKQHVPITSIPAGASIKINGEDKGKTPIAVDLKRNAYHTVLIEMPGYEPYRLETTKGVNPWVLGDILIFALPPIGFVVDFATGAFSSVEPKQITASLAKQDGSNSAIPTATRAKEKDTSSGTDTTERLKKLKEMRESNLITEDEYQQKRKTLIDTL